MFPSIDFIGDIHGHYEELRLLLTKLGYVESQGSFRYPGRTRTVVFLGDYIDRGNQARDVVNLVRAMRDSGDAVALMGNHEDMLLGWLDGESCSWEYNGCEATLRSYKGRPEDFQDDCSWMRNLPLYYEDDHYIYVHAGINPALPMDQQDRETLLWVRDEFIDNPVSAEKVVVFGHTPGCGRPYRTLAGNICLDAGCVFYGNLTAMVIEEDGGKTFCSSQSGFWTKVS